MERVAFYRPLTGVLLHPEVEAKSGSDTSSLSGPGDITFTVSPDWHDAVAEDEEKVLAKRKTLVVVERANKRIRQVGLVDDLSLGEHELTVSCGGFSMIFGQSGPWEGAQRAHVGTDPVALFRDLVAQVQSYENADLGIRVTGDTASGSSVGYAGSARWQNAEREVQRYKPELEKWESRVLSRERIVSQRQEAMFKAANVKRVGTVTVSDSEPDDPGYKADSTVWVHEASRRAYRFRDGRWVSQSQADAAVKAWLDYQPALQRAKDEVSRLGYLVEPAEALMEEYEAEGREEYGLYFWQNHDLGEVIEDLTELGPFEYREKAAWVTNADGEDRLDLQLEVGAPRVGVRRHELHLELGVNVHDQPVLEHGDLYTGVALFGAGEGSEVLSEQRSWDPAHAVRNILTETDKDAVTKSLTRSAANELLDQVRKDAGVGYTDLVIHHDDAACPEGSFDVGDELLVLGTLSSGERLDGWVRVLEATHEWGSNTTSIEVEQV